MKDISLTQATALADQYMTEKTIGVEIELLDPLNREQTVIDQAGELGVKMRRASQSTITTQRAIPPTAHHIGIARSKWIQGGHILLSPRPPSRQKIQSQATPLFPQSHSEKRSEFRLSGCQLSTKWQMVSLNEGRARLLSPVTRATAVV